MTTQRPRFLAHVQLLRLPNAIMAMADPLAGWFAVGGGVPIWQLPLLVGASACLYTSGVVFNDCFDYKSDSINHPERPLPSGAISLRTARLLGSALLIVALALAAVAGPVPLGVSAFLGAMIFFYNAWARRFTILRPLVLGTCHFASFLLGMRCLPLRLFWMPALLGAYACTIAFLPRLDPGNPALRQAIKRLVFGAIMVDAIVVMLSPFGDSIEALLVLSLLIPAAVLGKVLSASPSRAKVP